MLNKYNAQKIVDKTIKIFGTNINIIDSNGIILASGDPTRVDTFHEGAFIAVKENRTIEIYDNESKEFKGAKWGVNIPIYYRGSIQGVVGITGEPSHVSNLAIILKEMVELILGEMERMNVKALESKAENAYLRELLTKKQIALEFEERGKLLGIDLNLPRVCLILEIVNFKQVVDKYTDKYKDTFERELALQSLKNDIEEHIRRYCGYKDKTFHLQEATFVTLKDHQGGNLEKVLQFTEKIIDKLWENFSINTVVAIGEPVETSKEIGFSYKTAKSTMKILLSSNKKLRYMSARDYRIHGLVVDNIESLKIKLQPQLEIISKTKNWIALKDTLNIYFSNNLNILKTSKDMAVHRNTVISRLTKINEILNLNPFALEDCFILRLILIMDDFQ